MIRSSVLVVIALLLLSGPVDSAHSTLIINSWLLHTGVQDEDGEFRQEFAGSSQVQPSPWVAEYAVGGPPDWASWAAVQYDFTYGGDEAVFQLDTQQHCERVAGELPICATPGWVVVTPLVDTVLTYQASIDYSMPAEEIQVLLVGSVVRLDTGETIFGEGEVVDGAFDPPQGVLSIGGSATLLATHQYRINHLLRILHGTAVPIGSVAVGTGSVHVTLMPVPECSSLALLMLGVVAAGRRVRSR